MTTKGLLLRGPVPDRIESRLDRTGGCWLWTGKCDRGGYGRIWTAGRHRRVHRVAYEAWVGPIPEGLEIDHLCRVRNCVNPAHLEPVTQAENVRRQARSQKTECVNGHPYTPENTYLRPGKGHGRRDCRTCIRERAARYAARRKAGGAA